MDGDEHTDRVRQIEEVVGPVGAQRLGAVLRERRLHCGLEASDAAAAGLSARALLAIEAGRRRPEPAIILRLLDRYGCGIEELLPPRRVLDPAGFEGLSSLQVLQRYVEQVRRWRAGGNVRGQRFRAADLEILVGILGTDVDDIERRLIALTGCSRGTAKAFRRILVCSLLAATGVAFGQGVAGAREDLPPGASARAAPKAEEAATCASAGIPGPEAATDVRTGSGATRVGFTINQSVWVRLDETGSAVAVRTNTGRPPDCAAIWYSVRSGSDDAAEFADVDEINNLIAIATTDSTFPQAGDWIPGAWYALR